MFAFVLSLTGSEIICRHVVQ